MSIQSATISASPSAAGNVFVADGDVAITTMYLCNATGAAITCNLFVVNSGFDANATNKIYSNVIIAADDTMIIETERVILSIGDMIQANATPSGLVATLSYVGI